MDYLPLEILVHVFSFTDVKTWHSCRETCSTIAHLLKKRVFVIRSMQMKDFDTILQRSTADRVSVRFTKVPKATSTDPNIRRICEELPKIESITELDISELDSKVTYFPTSRFTNLESVRFSTSSISPISLAKLTKLAGLYLSRSTTTLHHPSASQLLDLEFSSFNGFAPEHCTNLTRLLLISGQGVDIRTLTALKDLDLRCYGMPGPIPVALATSDLESLGITGVYIAPDEILKNSNLTRLGISVSYIKGPENEDLDLSPWRLLTRLRDLSFDSVTRTAPLSFMNGLPNLERLAIRGKNPINDFSSEILPLDGSSLTRLLTVNIPYLDLSHFTALRNIAIRDGIGKIPSDNLTAIEANRIKEITFLGSLTNVRSLTIPRSMDFVTFPNLESLSITWYIFDNDPIQTLETLTLLTRLVIAEDNGVDLPYLVSLTNLVQLHILSRHKSMRKSTRRHVRHITNLQKLEELTLPRAITQQELDSISIHLTRLTYLSTQSKGRDASVLTRLTNLIDVHFGGPNMMHGVEKMFESGFPYLVTFEPYSWRHRHRFLQDLTSL